METIVAEFARPWWAAHFIATCRSRRVRASPGGADAKKRLAGLPSDALSALLSKLETLPAEVRLPTTEDRFEAQAFERIEFVRSATSLTRPPLNEFLRSRRMCVSYVGR